MRIIFELTKMHVIFSVIIISFILLAGFSAANIDPAKPWLFLKQIAVSETDQTSIDENNDGIIDRNFIKTDWTLNQTTGNIYRDAGNVGIGNNDPQTSLHVNGAVTANQFCIYDGSGLDCINKWSMAGSAADSWTLHDMWVTSKVFNGYSGNRPSVPSTSNEIIYIVIAASSFDLSNIANIEDRINFGKVTSPDGNVCWIRGTGESSACIIFNKNDFRTVSNPTGSANLGKLSLDRNGVVSYTNDLQCNLYIQTAVFTGDYTSVYNDATNTVSCAFFVYYR